MLDICQLKRNRLNPNDLYGILSTNCNEYTTMSIIGIYLLLYLYRNTYKDEGTYVTNASKSYTSNELV